MSDWVLVGGEQLDRDFYVAKNLIDYERDFIINPDDIYGLLEDREAFKRMKSKINYIEYRLGKGWVDGLYNALCEGYSDE